MDILLSRYTMFNYRLKQFKPSLDICIIMIITPYIMLYENKMRLIILTSLKMLKDYKTVINSKNSNIENININCQKILCQGYNHLT